MTVFYSTLKLVSVTPAELDAVNPEWQEQNDLMD